MDIERLVGDDLLELAVFLLQVLQPMGLGDFHPTVLSLPAVVGLVANAVPAAQVRQIDLKTTAHTPQLAAIGISSPPTVRSAL